MSGPFTSTIIGAGVTFSWSVVDGELVGEAKANTPGWVAVGFNTSESLDGSVLVLGSTEGVEEHVAQPPRHPPRSTVGNPGLRSGTAKHKDGWTVVSFRLKLDTGDGIAAGLAEGKTAFVTLAWSRDTDFSHHSAARTMVSTPL